MPRSSSTPPATVARSWSRRLAGPALATLTAAVVCLGTGPAPARADDCPNAAVRAQNDSTRLPDCRAYELVSNPFKEGFTPIPTVFYTDDGAYSYISPGNFLDNGLGGTSNPFTARRSPSGWTTTPYGPHGPTYAEAAGGNPSGFSTDLRSSLWEMRLAGETTDVIDLYLRGPDGVFTRIGPMVNPASLLPSSPGPRYTGPNPGTIVAVSSDLSHVVFSVLDSPNLFPGDTTNVYEYVGTGHERPRLVGLDDDGTQIGQCGGGVLAADHAASADGSVILFNGCDRTSPTTEVWARVDGTRSYELSTSRCTRAAGDPGGACGAPAPSDFAGASTDDAHVFFTTTQQLVNGDTDATADLYEADLPTPQDPHPAPIQVSGAATGADVQGTVRVSEDGTRAYFVATGVLAANHGANDAPAVAGDDNLYVWRRDAAHPDGQTTFVGRLDPADAGLWGSDAVGRMAQATGDGRFLVLSTYAALVAGGPSADTDTAQDIYRYDADTRELLRLSTSASGTGGNADGLDATMDVVHYQSSLPYARERPAMTADGSAIVFGTAERLAPADTDDVNDVYEWRAGHVTLISGGHGLLVAGTGSITSSGADIFFPTTDQFTPADSDTATDIYDARVDGGFDFTPAPACSGDACQGPGQAPPAAAGTPTTQPRSTTTVQTAPAFALRTVSAAARRRFASTGRLALTVTATTPGTVAVTATATVGGRSVTVASAHRTLTAAGQTSLTLTLSKKTRARLAAKGHLTVKLVASFSKVAVTHSATLKLVHGARS